MIELISVFAVLYAFMGLMVTLMMFVACIAIGVSWNWNALPFLMLFWPIVVADFYQEFLSK